MNNHNLRRLKALMKIPSESVVPTKQFNKDLKHLSKSGNYDLSRLKLAIELIRHHVKLSPGYDKYRLIYVNNEIDIHIASDWVLIYKELNDQSEYYIKLYRTGSHNWIFK